MRAASVLSRFVLELRVTRSPAFRKVTSQAARSIGLSMVLVASVRQPSTLRMLIWPEVQPSDPAEPASYPPCQCRKMIDSTLAEAK